MSSRPPLRRFRSKAAYLISRWRVLYFRMLGVEIGAGSYISKGARIDVRRGQIVIGERVNISHGCYILSHTGFQDEKAGQKTIIEDDVKIFVNSVVFPGVRIGRNSTVGASSVVTKNVPPNVIVMGNPARVIMHLDHAAKSPEASVQKNS